MSVPRAYREAAAVLGFITAAVLTVYVLILLGQVLFDAPEGDIDRYRTCLDAGGSYTSGDGSNYSCEVHE